MSRQSSVYPPTANVKSSPMCPEVSALALHHQEAPSRQHDGYKTTIRVTELHHRLNTHALK